MKKSANAFDCLRLLAAFAVLFSHSFALTGQIEDEPLAHLTNQSMDFGQIAVYVFFTISGFLVTQSWLKDPNISRYMMRRSLRIFPALIFVIVASCIILGPTFSALSPSVYFTQHETWTYLAKILIYPAQYGLPGVFDGNSYKDVVNGSLWTLRLEFTFYVGIAAFGYWGLLRWRFANIGVALILLMFGLILIKMPNLKEAPFTHQLTVFILNTIPFFIGAAIAQNGFKTRDVSKIFLLAAFLATPLIFFGAVQYYVVLILPLITLLLAQNISCNLAKFGDYSYGVYLWGFPMQQCVVACNPSIGPLKLCVFAGALTLTCAIISWHIIEKRALTFKPQRKIAYSIK